MIHRAAAVTSVAVLAMWLGAMLITTAVVAPAAFAVLSSRTLAGALVGRVLPVLFIGGMVVGALVILVSRSQSMPSLIAGVLMILACAGAQFVVTPRIEMIRVIASAPLDSLDASDPRRISFGRLHGASVLLLGVAGLSALFALVVTARQLSK